MNPRIEKIKQFLICPDCQGELKFMENLVQCSCCKKNYPIKNQKIYFTEVASVEDSLDKLKSLLKKLFGKYYHTLGINIFAPTYPFNYRKEILKWTNPQHYVVIDIGSGNNRIHPQIITVDIFDYENVDIVCNLEKLPFRPESIDAFVSRSVIEHLSEPEIVIKNLYRCTRKEGFGIHLIPFMFPFHASPYDFQRYTHEGIKRLFKNFNVIHQRNVTGPVTLFLLCLIEFLSIILSFGSDKIKPILYLFFCLLLFPLKFFDIFFINCKKFLTLAPTILTVVKKE